MSETQTEGAPPPDGVIVCRVTPWFFRRMGWLTLILAGMGFYFLYDGRYGYRKDNFIAERKEWFEGPYLKSFDQAKAAGRLEEWIAQGRKEGLPTGENGEPPKWASYAAEHGWPEQPKKHAESEIFQQFEWGGAMLFLALVAAGKALLDRRKTFTGHGEHMVMPGGGEVRYADVFKVDKRKWNDKALAYVFYRPGGQGAARRVVVDDLKYEGAGRVLDRLLANFRGELIEKVPDEDTGGGGPSEPGERRDGGTVPGGEA